MISFYSLKSKITATFMVSILLLLILSYISFELQIENRKADIVKQERDIVRYIYQYFFQTKNMDISFLQSQNIKLITDKKNTIDIINLFSQKEREMGYSTISYQQRRFIFVRINQFIFIFENMNKPKFPTSILIIFIGGLIFLLSLYFMIINSLKPLTTLKNKIHTFSQGNLDINCKSDKKDEIAQVANEFHHAVQKIKELKHSRQLLLRAIMHELKTPIAKGKLVTEMTINQKYKEKLHNIFNRLNLLIDEFAKIEMITSKNFNTNLKDYKMTDIIDASIDMLMLDNPHNHIKIEIKKDYIIQADFQLLPLAIKNLLDNAIKYNSTKSITIVINNAIEITNIGSQLDEPLQNYYTPFRTKSHGLGLGLYIVKNILDIHKLQLIYSYKTPLNKFMIIAKS
jgi:two-component system OmpR family sensor kinase